MFYAYCISSRIIGAVQVLVADTITAIYVIKGNIYLGKRIDF